MSIERSGFPLPDLDDRLTAPYFTASARGELAIPRCAVCARWCWYPQAACPACGGVLEWTVTAGRGRLFSWAVVRRPFLPAFADMVPFVTALVELEEDPAVRLVTLVVDAGPEGLEPGSAMEAVHRPLRFPTVVDREVVVPMFRPVVAA